MKNKITIQQIRNTKKIKEKLVYLSVTDCISAKWVKMEEVDVSVVEDSLAMTAHGFSNTTCNKGNHAYEC